jgi:hypothetical protein
LGRSDMKTALIAAAFSVLAIVPAAAQSCVSNGTFVPCQGGMGAGMGGGMAPGAMGGPAAGMQPAGAGIGGGPAMADRRMERRHASRHAAKRVKRPQQAESADQ